MSHTGTLDVILKYFFPALLVGIRFLLTLSTLNKVFDSLLINEVLCVRPKNLTPILRVAVDETYQG